MLTAEEEEDDEVADEVDAEDDDHPEVDAGESEAARLDASISLELGEEFTDPPLMWPVSESLLDTKDTDTEAGGTVDDNNIRKEKCEQ